MKIEVEYRGKLSSPLGQSTKVAAFGEKDSLLVSSNNQVCVHLKDKSVIKLTKKLGFLTRASVLTTSQNGRFVAGVTDTGHLFKFYDTDHPQWISSPGLEKTKVTQICVDDKGDVVVSNKELTVYRFDSSTSHWDVYHCPFNITSSSAPFPKVNLSSCQVTLESDVYCVFSWLLEDCRLVVCNLGYKYLDKNLWRIRDSSPSLFPCSSLTISPDLSCFLLHSSNDIHLIANTQALPHFQFESPEPIISCIWSNDSSLLLILQPNGDLALLAKFMNTLFGFEQAGNEHGVPSSWMPIVQVDVGSSLHLRSLNTPLHDGVIITSKDLHTISVHSSHHVKYLSGILSAKPLTISFISEICLYLSSLKILHKEHVLLLAQVKKTISRLMAVCRDVHLSEVSQAICNILQWSVQLESVPIIKLMIYALRRFLKVDRNKKYKTQVIEYYRNILRTYSTDEGSLYPRVTETRVRKRRRSSSASITDEYYNGDINAAMNLLLQGPAITTSSKELIRRLLETDQEFRAFEAFIIITSKYDSRCIFDTAPKSRKLRSLMRMFASKVKHPSVSLEFLWMSNYWKDTLRLCDHLQLTVLTSIIGVALNDTRETAMALRKHLLHSLRSKEESMESVLKTTTYLLHLNPAISLDTQVETMDLLMTELITEINKVPFESPDHFKVVTDITNYNHSVSKIELLGTAMYVLLICSEGCGEVLEELHVSLTEETTQDEDSIDFPKCRVLSLLKCFVNIDYCCFLREKLATVKDDSEAVLLAQQLYVNSFIPSNWLPHLASIVYAPSNSEIEKHHQSFIEYYDHFVMKTTSTRSSYSHYLSSNPCSQIKVSQTACVERVIENVKKMSTIDLVTSSDICVIKEESLNSKLSLISSQQIKLKSGSKIHIGILSELLESVKIFSSRAFICGLLLNMECPNSKKVRFNPIVDVAVDEEEEREKMIEKLKRTLPIPLPRGKLALNKRSNSMNDAAVQAHASSYVEGKLSKRLDKALKSLDRIAKLQKSMSRSASVDTNELPVKEAATTLIESLPEEDETEEEEEEIELKDIKVSPKPERSWRRPFEKKDKLSAMGFSTESKFEESMRRIRDLTSRSINRYHTSTRNFRSSLRAKTQSRSPSAAQVGGGVGARYKPHMGSPSIRVRVKPSESGAGVHTTFVIDGRTKAATA